MSLEVPIFTNTLYNMGICLWILGSIVVAISLLVMSMFEGKKEELRENVVLPDGSFAAAVSEALTEPQERLRNLDCRLTLKHNRLNISQEKLDETKRTISELEITSTEVQAKYRDLLRQMKSELAKTESECQHLHDQIEQITTKRDKLKQELDEKQARFPSEIGIVLSDARRKTTDVDLLSSKKPSAGSVLEQERFAYISPSSKSYSYSESGNNKQDTQHRRPNSALSSNRHDFSRASSGV